MKQLTLFDMQWLENNPEKLILTVDEPKEQAAKKINHIQENMQANIPGSQPVFGLKSTPLIKITQGAV